VNAETKIAPAETHSFQADVSRLLHMMVHSVYSDKDIFVRELISNAADACEKLRYEAISNPALTEGETAFLITITADKEARTLTFEDNGVGMDRDDLVHALGTIANSGTRAFMERAGRTAPVEPGEEKEVEGGSGSSEKLIGQFGVGFYSVFMVTDKVEVATRKAGDQQSWLWSSTGAGSFDIAAISETLAPRRGTRVTLHLKDSATQYMDEWTLEKIVREHSGAVGVPVEFKSSPEAEPKRLSEGRPLWSRSRSDISEKEYAAYYQTISGHFDEPALTLHWRAEGRFEYTALAFVPGAKPFDLFEPSRKGHGRLYVRGVLISDEFEIAAPWLRFVQIVIDAADLPLNVSREIIQQTPMLAAIKRAVTNRIVNELVKCAETDPDRFNGIWERFGPVLKEGLYEDPERRDSLYKLARFATTAGEKRSLAEYVSALRPNQTAIYYLVGDSAARLAASPQLEGFRSRGVEVLLLSDPVDAFWVETAAGYDGKPFQSVTRSETDIGAIPLLDGASAEDSADVSAEVATFIAFMKQTLGDNIADVRASKRLYESVACLVADTSGPDMRLRQILQAHGKLSEAPKSVLELNAAHTLVASLAQRLASGADKELIEDASWLILDEARLMEGEAPTDPARFAARLARTLQRALG
jgi:molecular chaperone HtpG